MCDTSAIAELLTLSAPRLIERALCARGMANHSPRVAKMKSLLQRTVDAATGKQVKGQLGCENYSVLSLACTEIAAKGEARASVDKYAAQLRRRIAAFRLLEGACPPIHFFCCILVFALL